ADEPDRERCAAPLRVLAPRERLVERRRRSIQVVRLQTALDTSGVGLHGEADAFVHRRGERLRAPHPAESAGEYDPATQRIPEMPCCDGGERLIGALENPLRADVDP